MSFFQSLGENAGTAGTVIGVILCVVVGLVLIYLLIYASIYLIMRNAQKKTPEQRPENHEQDEMLRREISAFRAQAEEQSKRTQQELDTGLRRFNDAMVRLVGEVTRTQQSQLDSFGGQLRATSRVEEERMEKMSEMVERQLTGYDQRMQHITKVLDYKLEANEQRMERMRQSLEGGLTQLREENAKQLTEMRATVDEKLHTTLDRRLGESFQLVNEQLEKVTKGLGEMQSLATGVGDLKRVLTNIKTRGIWGEVQLGALLEQILAPGQYAANVKVSPTRDEHVEYAIILPGNDKNDRPVYLPVDAKCPIEDYQRLVTASEQGDQAALEAAAKALAGAIRQQAKQIHDKYIEPPYTTDYAVMFLPIEGLYAEALRSGSLVESLQKEYRVVLTGPTTLAALLNSLQMGFRTLAIEQRTSEVWELLGAVKTEFSRFSELLARTQRRLRQASDSIDDAARKTRTIERKLRGVTAGEQPLTDTAQSLRMEEELPMPEETPPRRAKAQAQEPDDLSPVEVLVEPLEEPVPQVRRRKADPKPAEAPVAKEKTPAKGKKTGEAKTASAKQAVRQAAYIDAMDEEEDSLLEDWA